MMFIILSCFALAYASVEPLVPGGTIDRPNLLNGENIFVQKALDAINQYYVKQGDKTPWRLVKVTSATSQVVSGTNYRFVLEVTQGSKVASCVVGVWSRPWISGDEGLTVYSDPDCSPVGNTIGERGLNVGGESPADVTDPEVQKALAFAEKKYNALINYGVILKVVSVSKVTKQVVSGVSFHFFGVKFESTNCKKVAEIDPESCVVNKGGESSTLEFKVIYQPWLTPEVTLNIIDEKWSGAIVS